MRVSYILLTYDTTPAPDYKQYFPVSNTTELVLYHGIADFRFTIELPSANIPDASFFSAEKSHL